MKLNAFATRLHRLIPCLLAGLISGSHGTPGLSAPTSDRDVVSFLQHHCVECHGEEDPDGDVSLHDPVIDFTQSSNVASWQRVLEQLTLGQMPPADQDAPTASEQLPVTQWISSQFREANIAIEVEHKLRAPGFGNFVQHEKLFDGSQPGPASSPPRLWRLHPHVYETFVDSVGGSLRRETAIHQPFALDESKGQFSDFGAVHFADSAALQLLLMNCQTIVEYQTTGVHHRDHEGKPHRLKRTPPEFEIMLSADRSPTQQQIQTAIDYEYRLLLERAPTAEEQQQLLKFCQAAIERAGVARGLQTTLKAILLKPEAVYRMELGLGAKDEYGRRRLAAEELAFALARALSHLGPSDIRLPWEGKTRSLLDLALAGELETPEAIQRVVLRFFVENDMRRADYRMFTQDHLVGNSSVLRFFREFFGYHHAPNVFKDEKRIGHGDRFDRKRIVHDADQLVMHLFDQDRDVLKQLLTTDQYFVAYLGSADHIKTDLHYIKTNKNDANFTFNTGYVQRAEAEGRHPIPIEGPETRMYVGFYNLDHETWDYPTQQPFRLPAGQRAGLLMHPAWLIAWSGNFDNDPIRRGKWIREHLLAGTIPDVPLNVNAVVPEDPQKSLRARLQVTREAACWQCHQRMEPLGLPFEAFDDFGRQRDAEMVGELLSIFPERHTDAKTLPLQTHGKIALSGESQTDGEVESAFQLVHRLAESTRVRQSFVRHAFRFWLGRNESLNDSPTLMAADKAYVEHGGSMQQMIAALLSSDSFLYRKEKP